MRRNKKKEELGTGLQYPENYGGGSVVSVTFDTDESSCAIITCSRTMDLSIDIRATVHVQDCCRVGGINSYSIVRVINSQNDVKAIVSCCSIAVILECAAGDLCDVKPETPGVAAFRKSVIQFGDEVFVINGIVWEFEDRVYWFAQEEYDSEYHEYSQKIEEYLMYFFHIITPALLQGREFKYMLDYAGVILGDVLVMSV